MDQPIIKQLSEIPAHEGPHSIPGIRFRPARAALEVSAWGMNVLEIDAGCVSYPEHDHQEDGQEEVYFIVDGSAEIVVDGQKSELAKGSFCRVAPKSKRKILPGPAGVVLLAIGATPGKAFAPTIA